MSLQVEARARTDAALIGVSARPEFSPEHPWGCHRRRVPDRVVFDHVLAALVHGSGYERIATSGCSRVPRRGDIVDTDTGVRVLVVSSTVYNEIPSEPTVVIVPVFASEPDAGFGVDLGDGWAAPGLISSLRKTRLRDHVRHVDVQTLTDVNTMLFRILATPER